MALILLQVIVLGVTAAASHDVPITWSHSSRAALPCVVAEWPRRRPLPLLDDERARPARPYLWRRADTELSGKRISPNGTLEVSKKRDGEGVYQCGVRHHNRLVLGNPINLRFAYMDKQFSVHPGNQTAREGQPAVLSCGINSGPPANISWERDGAALPEDARYHKLDNELIITDVKQEDAGVYRCKATNQYLNRVPTSHAGELQVEKSEDQDVRFLDVHYQKNVTAARGSKVVLACPVLGWPRPKLIWELTPANGRTCELDVTDEILVLSQLEYDQTGLYSCSVEGHSDLVKTFNVSLWEPVRITLPPASKESVRASTVRFNCTATGQPKPTIAWYKDGQPLKLSGRFNLRTSTDKARIELVISGVTSDDAGIYQCFASTPYSMATSWALLSVRGASAAPPTDVTCAPVGPHRVEVRWRPATKDASNMTHAAYFVAVTPLDAAGMTLTGQPHTNTAETVSLGAPLAPHYFQVRAVVSSAEDKWAGVASDMSERVVCQGQGVPFKLIKLTEDEVLVSWQRFAESVRGVRQWVLQTRPPGGAERNLTLAADVTAFNLTGLSSPLEVRVLGSRTLPWLPQDLSRLPWTSTAAAVSRDQDLGDSIPVPRDLQVEELGSRGFTVRWAVDGPAPAGFLLCVRAADGAAVDTCQESDTTRASVEGLSPGALYEVRVRARGGAFCAPLQLATPHDVSQRLKELKYKFVNSSTLRVWWAGEGGAGGAGGAGGQEHYTVWHSTELRLPVLDKWPHVDVVGNSATIYGLDPAEPTFVMVTGYNPLEHSQILKIPPQIKDMEVKDLKYKYSSGGLTVWWSVGAVEGEGQGQGEGQREGPREGQWQEEGQGEGQGDGCATPQVVRYSQNITRPLERWNTVNVTACNVELRGLDPRLPVYVMVDGGSRHNQMLNVLPRPPDAPDSYLVPWIGAGCALAALCALAGGAACVWRRRKRARDPHRRRRVASGDETLEEDGSEMKSVCTTGASGAGARLANGGVRDGEPLLNGHVHITENPASKTPNGRMKRGRAYDAFDVSRHDADTTAETVLDDSYGLLDTSRPPDTPHPPRDNPKLPDDNMNSELTSILNDNSKIHPTLQPNG